MASHSSSASLSSFSFSHFSHTSSSSPSSSPDSIPSSSSCDTTTASPTASSKLSIVPFLWEEKPGVLKKEMQLCEEDEANAAASCRDIILPPHDILASRSKQKAEHMNSCKKLSRTCATPMARSKTSSEYLPCLRPPPCFSHPEQPDAHTEVHRQHHHHHQASTGVLASTVMSSLSFHKRRYQRSPSLEDDPFWLAMVACTNDTSNSARCSRKSDPTTEPRKDSWLAKKVHGEYNLHFDQCIPHHAFANFAISKREQNKRKEAVSKDQESSFREGIKPSSELIHAYPHRHGHHGPPSDGAESMRLTSKAFKALSLAKSELHGRCKALLQQQSAPVDMSCGVRHSKKRNSTSKHKLPDLFGCKSDRWLIYTSR